MDDSDLEPNRPISIVPEPNEKLLREKELLDYYEYRKSILTWLLQFGKNPNKAEGYSPYTVYTSAINMARFDRWTWENNEGYTIPPTEEDGVRHRRD